MRRPTLLLTAAFCAATAMAAPPKSGITPANYVEIGDTVVDMLDTTGLAFSTGVLGRADRARPRFTAFTAFTAPTPRTETFEAPCPGGGHHTASVNGSMTLGRMPLRLVQDDPFVLAPDGTPRSGRLTTTDTEGNRLQVDAGARRYSYRYFGRSNRGESPDSTSQSKPR